MRPINKGLSPRSDDYSHYRDALDDLVGRIGFFCCYCEQPIQHAPEIEHVQPKCLNPELERSWENLLLSCSTCNRTKGNSSVDLDQVAMPDMDNTFRGLVYHQYGNIEISPDLTEVQTDLMKQVVRLVRLDRHPDAKNSDDRPTSRDRRFQLRSDIWDVADRVLNRLEQSGKDAGLADTIVDSLAPSKGFFSIWMTVFRDHPDMLQRFIEIFPGTDSKCFDDQGLASHRPGGRL